MPPKSGEDSTTSVTKNYPKETAIIQTTYEKVLSIINNVKELIKKHVDNSQKVLDDLEWVTKVISNKSLYSYEIRKPLVRRDSEYNKFVAFFNKYNEEVIEMNKKHILVTGLLNIVKGEIITKPSLCLKRILPDELKNMDYKKEVEKKIRKKNLINLIGNAILNLYYKTLEKQKKEKENNQKNNKIKKEKENEQKSKLAIGKKSMKNKTKTTDAKKKNELVQEKPNKNLINCVTSNDCTKKMKSQNYISLTKNDKHSLNSIKNAMKKYYFKYSMLEHQVNRPLHQYINKSNLIKNKNIKRHNSTQKKYNIYLEKESKDSKKATFHSFKTKLNINDTENKDKKNSTEINVHINVLRNRMRKIHQNSNFLNSTEYHNFNKNYFRKKNKKMIYKTIQASDHKKNNSTQQTIYNKKIKEIQENNNKNNFRDFKQKNISLVNTNIINTLNYTLNNNANDSLNKMYSFSYNLQKNEKNQLNNDTKNKDNILVKNEREPLKILIAQYYEDLKEVMDKDFDIFDFKLKVGYKNVLPLMCHCILKVLGLLDNRIILLSKLQAFLYKISDSYKETTLYHNSLHGADVTQSLCIYFINTNAEEICEASVLDLLGMIISAMGHDLGHPGLTNNFHINSSSDLAITYNDASCLENYHCSFLFKILKSDETNIFEKLSVENYKKIRKRMISQILATDMANHGEVISLIRAKIITFEAEADEEAKNDPDNSFVLLSGNEKTKFDEQQILFNYLIHCADLGHNCKKYEISKKWIKLLCEEFWIQGDKEKSLGIPVSFLCDREKIDVPASQVGFLKGFIFSTFNSLVEIFPSLKFTMSNAKRNLSQWQKLLEQKRATGWTPKKEKNKEKEKEKVKKK